MRTSGTLAVTIASAALLAGCGQGEEPEARPQGTAPDTKQQPGKADVAVAMKDYEFIPANVKVKAGESITWTNEDEGIQHNAVAREGQGPKSELFNGGETYTWTAKDAGTIDYVCTIHPGMDGTITVR